MSQHSFLLWKKKIFELKERKHAEGIEVNIWKIHYTTPFTPQYAYTHKPEVL